MWLSRLALLSVVGVFVLTPISLLAATKTLDAPVLNPSRALSAFGETPMSKPDGLSTCLDHYTFGSTPVVLQSELGQVAAGSNLSFKGTVGNTNPYNIPNASLWVKVVRTRATHDANGPDVVDFYKVADNIHIPAGGSVPISGSWHVPTDAVNGQYRIATFVIESNRFNLQGLSFSDDIVGNSLGFVVVGGTEGTVSFVKNAVTLFGAPYFFAAFPPSVGAGATPPVVATIQNSTHAGYKGVVDWKLYYWDSLGGKYLLDERRQDVKVQPHASTTVEYDVKDTTHSVYYLVGTLTTATGSKSIIGVRFARTGTNTPRLNFVGYDPSGVAPVAFACVHSTNNAPSDNSTVTLSVYRAGVLGTLLNVFGPVASARYEGKIPSDIYALTVPVKTSGPLTIHAELFQNGKSVDAVSEPYCAKGTCSNLSLVDWITLIAVTLIALGIVIVLIREVRRRGHAIIYPVDSGPDTTL